MINKKAVTEETLTQLYWTALQHPPHSPDLSPCNYNMFGPLKEALGGQRFDDDEQVENFGPNLLQTRPLSFYVAGLKKLPILWQKCIEKGRIYVESENFFIL